MNIKIALSALLLLGGVLIVRSGIDAFSVVPASETVAQAQADLPQDLKLMNDRIFDMPGSGNCDACHAQPGRSSQAQVSPPVTDEQRIQRL